MLSTGTYFRQGCVSGAVAFQAAPVPRRWRRLREHSVRALAAFRARAADQRGSQITDNLGLVVIGIVAIVAIGGLISGLDKAVFNWITQQLGLG
jgi:hypothetical protein